MAETNRSSGFPYLTAVATVLTLFLFLGLVIVAYRSPNYLGDSPADTAIDGATKLNEVKARNRAVLDGKDATVKMSANEAAEKLTTAAEQSKDATHKHGVLPYPAEPKVPEKKDKK